MDYKEKTIIDLSDATNISDLVLKINSELESDNTRDKNVYLNLGKIDLKQSQLLSIKALIETMDSKLAGVQTSSDMTEASAVGLGLPVGDFSPKTTPTFSETFKNTSSQEEKIEENNSNEISSFAQLKKMNSIGDFVTDAQTLQEVNDENLEEETKEFLDEVDSEEDEYTEKTSNIEVESKNNIDDSELFKTRRRKYLCKIRKRTRFKTFRRCSIST